MIIDPAQPFRLIRGHSVDFGDNLQYRATSMAALDIVKRASQRRSFAQLRKSTELP